MVSSYLCWRDLSAFDVWHEFHHGNQVVLHVPQSSKLELGIQGPFCFIQYTCWLGMTAIIKDIHGIHHEVSVANLLPRAAVSW